MHPSRKFPIDEVGHRLVGALEKLKWKVEVGTDIFREFKHYFVSKNLVFWKYLCLLKYF